MRYVSLVCVCRCILASEERNEKRLNVVVTIVCGASNKYDFLFSQWRVWYVNFGFCKCGTSTLHVSAMAWPFVQAPASAIKLILHNVLHGVLRALTIVSINCAEHWLAAWRFLGWASQLPQSLRSLRNSVFPSTKCRPKNSNSYLHRREVVPLEAAAHVGHVSVHASQHLFRL